MYKIAIFEKLYIDFNLGINYDFVLVKWNMLLLQLYCHNCTIFVSKFRLELKNN